MGEEMYYVVTYDSKMVAMVTITDTVNFDLSNFLQEINTDGYKAQSITKEQKDILLPKDLSLN
jgi:replication initiation and membrane attachment protein DnaB